MPPKRKLQMSKPTVTDNANFGRRASDNESETRRVVRVGPSKRQDAIRDTERMQRIEELGAEARLFESPRITGKVLRISLPVVIDAGNARALRRRVLASLPHCQTMDIDADKLECLGDLGCAYLWQILSVSKQAGVEVVLRNVSERVHHALNRAWATDSARLVSIDGAEAPVLVECEGELQISGKTLRVCEEGDEVAEDPTIVKSWTERLVLKLMPRRLSA